MKRKTVKFRAGLVFAFLLFLTAMFALLPSVTASAATEEDGTTTETPAQKPSVSISTNYWFERIDVEVDVRKDKTYAVKETMKVGFLRGGVNTGIIRDIQRVSMTTHVIDGKQYSGKNFLTDLTDVEVTLDGESARVTREYYNNGQFFSVKMQTPDLSYFEATDQRNKTGYHIFELSYVYDMSQDKAEGYDDFTFDVLGYTMAYTRVFSAKITFPEGTDLSNTAFRTNRKEVWVPDQFDPHTGEGSENCSVRDNVIKMLAVPASADRGYTVQVLLPDGYFEVEGVWQFGYYWAFFAVALLSIVGAGVLFYFYCPRKSVEVITVTPPEGMRALRFSSVWHSGARSKDAAAVITQWADEGYIRIEQDGKKDLLLHKVKDLPETLSKEERDYFDAMFPKGDWTGCETFSTKTMRGGGYAMRDTHMRIALHAMVRDADIPDPLVKGVLRAHVLMTVCALLPALMIFIYSCILNLTALPLLLFVFMLAGTAVGTSEAYSHMTPIAYIFPLTFTAMPYGVLWGSFYLALYDYAGLFFLAIAVWAVCLVLMHFLKRRTEESLREYGYLRGFKRFLLTAELSRIEALFQDDPDYFSHIIPYCLVMGISDKVAKRFKALNVAMPEWAQAAATVGFSSFARSLSSSSGGGHSGGGGGHGGSSGGGGGGGGSRGC